MTAPTAGERIAHFMTLFFVGSLMALYGMVRLSANDLDFSASVIGLWLLQIAPLLACIPGVLRGNMTAAMLLAMAALFYFSVGVWTLMDASLRGVGGAEIVFSLGLFASTFLFMRYRGRRLRAAAEASNQSEPSDH